MKKALWQIKAFVNPRDKRAKALKVGAVALAVFLVLKVYCVRELLAAELFFGLGFAVLLVLGGLAYLVGFVGQRAFEFAEVGLRMIGTRRAMVSSTSKESIESHSTSELQGSANA